MLTRTSHDPIVITGIGIIASVGGDRESVWRAIRYGKSGVRRLAGEFGAPEFLRIGAPVDLPPSRPDRMKLIDMLHAVTGEAMADARIKRDRLDRDRFGCAISSHMGDDSFVPLSLGAKFPNPDGVPWWEQWLPNTACATIGRRFGLCGPRIAHSTACASGLIDFLAAVRAIEDNQCDIALTGAAEGFHPLFAAGFEKMRVLASHQDPTQACRPFDIDRRGFVMGEGGAAFVIERLSHALSRGAKIYAEVLGSSMLAEAHHVTGLDDAGTSLAEAIRITLDRARLQPRDVGYINAHGTGTQQNDITETRGIRQALGHAADDVCVSALKSMLGHLVNASGSVELALTVLALRDGFAPPTINLTDPDPACDLDCVPLRGRTHKSQAALKLSVAFGGHLVAVAIRRWNDAATGFGYPIAPAA